MQEFLNVLKEYELLFELILTATSLIISVFVVCQTRNLAKRQGKQDREIAEKQNELQKRQIRLELFERKLQINNALNQIFRFAQGIKTLCENFELENMDYEEINQYFQIYVEKINEEDIYGYVDQAQYILNEDVYESVRTLNMHFRLLLTNIFVVKAAADGYCSKTNKAEKIEEIIKCCDRIIGEFKSTEQFMSKELNIVRIDK